MIESISIAIKLKIKIMASHYYSLLTNLSQRLSKENLDNLVFACSDVLPSSTIDQIISGIHLFRELKQRDYLGPANYDYLRKQLTLVGRHDLALLLPDQFQIFFGGSNVEDKGYFGCFVSPTTPETSLVDTSLLSVSCDPNTDSRMFLLHLSQHLKPEDVTKLAFLMYPMYSQVTGFELAQLLEKEGGLTSIDVLDRLSSCLQAIGRIDLVKLLDCFKFPQLPLTTLSTSQQQLNLKIRLLLHSKQQSYDFYMKSLNEVQGKNEVRIKLLSPIAGHFRKSFDYSTLSSLAKCLQCSASSCTISFGSLIRTSLLEALQINQSYSTRTSLLYLHDFHIEELCKTTEQAFISYKSFDSFMDILNWNQSVRGELKEHMQSRKSPFGTPAELACQYIHELSQEISQCSTLSQEMVKIDRHLHALSGVYYCCCHHVLVLQWLASLLCFTISFGCAALDQDKYREILWHIIKQKKKEIINSYCQIADAIGLNVLKQLIPLDEKRDADTSHSPANPFVHFFNVLVIKLLAVATLGPESLNICDTFYTVDDKFYDQAWPVGSHELQVSATAMKKQVEYFRERALSEDKLCHNVISKLTDSK